MAISSISIYRKGITRKTEFYNLPCKVSKCLVKTLIQYELNFTLYFGLPFRLYSIAHTV